VKTQEREGEFHDHWAASESLEKIDIRSLMQGAAALENRFILQEVGDCRNLLVAELGAGLGEASVFFSRAGARVITADLSRGMLKFAGRLAQHHQTGLELVQTSAEQLPFRSNSIDLLYVANTLHHVTNLRETLQEMERVLKPGGRLVTIDPLAYNPLINIYRRMATQVRTVDEHPLRREDIALVQEFFPRVSVRMFWLTTLILFLKFFFVDRIHPNADRYWKRIYRRAESVQPWFGPLACLDEKLLRIFPPLRWWCWNVVLIAQKA
jgi:ubiquinone/menaquinone biosynthesis C-methylase UbiE